MSSNLGRGLAILAAIGLPGSIAGAGGARPTAKPGTVEARVSLELGLNEDSAKDPISLSPDIRFGVSEALDIGLLHSTEAVTGFAGFQSGASLCVSEAPLCELFDVYHNAGLEGRYALHGDDGFGLATSAAVLANQLDPLRLAVKLGASSWWSVDRLSVSLDPNVQLALTDREAALDVLGIPVAVVYGSRQLRVRVQTGVFSSLDSEVIDNLRAPASAEIASNLDDWIAAGVGFALPALYGGRAVAQTGLEARTLVVWLELTSPELR